MVRLKEGLFQWLGQTVLQHPKLYEGWNLEVEWPK